LDILGFKDLIARSTDDHELMVKLSQITTVGASPVSGEKATSLGPCLVQMRSFSDCIVIFMPIDTTEDEPAHPNPLAQLCFLARYFHDQALELGVCIRGGIATGPMFWNQQWSRRAYQPRRTNGLPLTFGQGLVDAYSLENTTAVQPRIVLSDTVLNYIYTEQLQASPFADFGGEDLLYQYIKCDSDGVSFLDVLHPSISRSANERLKVSPGGFTVGWRKYGESTHEYLLNTCDNLINEQLANCTIDSVRSKYEWLQQYAIGHSNSHDTD
tara:strand:- start:2300 stop:3109 length:810 start_codon:yes stop_codon:yes gene_type:complete